MMEFEEKATQLDCYYLGYMQALQHVDAFMTKIRYDALQTDNPEYMGIHECLQSLYPMIARLKGKANDLLDTLQNNQRRSGE